MDRNDARERFVAELADFLAGSRVYYTNPKTKTEAATCHAPVTTYTSRMGGSPSVAVRSATA